MTPAKAAPRLKPCPFCGANIMDIAIVYGYGLKNHYQVICRNCGACAADTPDKEGAAMFWNRRSSRKPRPARLAGKGR